MPMDAALMADQHTATAPPRILMDHTRGTARGGPGGSFPLLGQEQRHFDLRGRPLLEQEGTGLATIGRFLSTAGSTRV